MPNRISDLRKRKLALYAALSPAGESAGLAPEGDVDDLTYLRVLAHVAAASRPQTALEVGSRRCLADLGILGHLIASAATLSETLQIWQKHADMAGELASMRSLIRGDGAKAVWTIEFEPAAFLSPQLARFTLEELTATFFSLVRETTAADLAGFQTDFPFAAHPAVQYERYIPGTIRFQRRKARISGPAALLSLPQRAQDRETFQLLLSRIGAGGQQLEPASIRQRLLDYFLAHANRPPRIGDGARALGLSARTLHRRLAAEQTSFAEILAEFRYAWARDLLRSEQISVAQIANLLGFRNENSFRRAFRAWSGAPVGAWRRRESASKNGSLA